jgi:hypothetical protein
LRIEVRFEDEISIRDLFIVNERSFHILDHLPTKFDNKLSLDAGTAEDATVIVSIILKANEMIHINIGSEATQP